MASDFFEIEHYAVRAMDCVFKQASGIKEVAVAALGEGMRSSAMYCERTSSRCTKRETACCCLSALLMRRKDASTMTP